MAYIGFGPRPTVTRVFVAEVSDSARSHRGYAEPDSGADRLVGARPDRTRTQRDPRAGRGHRAARVAMTVATGMLAVATTASQVATATPSPLGPVRLVSGSSPLQAVVDELAQAQQQMQADMAQYPFVTPADLPMAHEYAQNALSTMLAATLVNFNFEQGRVAVPLAPYAWGADATNMQQLLVYANPDNQYTALPLLPGHTYTMTIDPPAGPNGTGTVNFVFTSGNGVSEPYQSISSYSLSQATPNPDGSYTLTFSSTPQPDATNWVDIPDNAERTIVRDSVANWGLPHDTMTLTEEGVPATTAAPLLSEQDVISILNPVAQNAVHEVNSPDYLGQLAVTNAPLPNTVSDFMPTHTFMPGPLLTGDNQFLSAGDFSLQPDQALILKVPDIDGAYSAAMVTNIYGQTAPAATGTGSLNPGQTFHDPDGFTYYVISDKDPGVANWLNDNGAEHGGIWLRLQGLDHAPSGPVPVQTQVVDVADVKQYLPDDTPTVTAAERAADLQQRLFEWDYAHDQNQGVAWIGANLVFDQVKAAVGEKEFDEIFGGQGTQFGDPVDIPSVSDRMTDPSLIPNITTLLHDFQADPAGAMLAIKDNLHLAVNDIEMPTILAALRLEVVIEQTIAAVRNDISSGDASNVLTDLVTGLKGIGTVFNETFTDPGTSITAGFLNARDDLAVSIMNASSYSAHTGDSASFGDALSQLVQSVSQELNPSAAVTDFSTLSGEISSQFASHGADVASSIAASSTDLLP